MSLMTKRDAIRAGRERGRNAASWMFDGNTTDATYRAFLAGWEEGDPEIMNRYQPPSWLSGEWAGESISELLGDAETQRDLDRLEDVEQAYSDAADVAYWRELERVAWYHVGRDHKSRRAA